MKTITFGGPRNTPTAEVADIHVTRIEADRHSGMVKIILEKGEFGGSVQTIELTTEHAIDIGLINLNPLLEFIK